jgi:hypothetical protein
MERLTIIFGVTFSIKIDKTITIEIMLRYSQRIGLVCIYLLSKLHICYCEKGKKATMNSQCNIIRGLQQLTSWRPS